MRDFVFFVQIAWQSDLEELFKQAVKEAKIIRQKMYDKYNSQN